MYPAASALDIRSARVKVDNESSSFFAGMRARTFREISLAAGASLYVRMVRPVDIVIHRFGMYVNAGQIRCEVYRGATPAGVWAESLPVMSVNEMANRPTPLYVPQSHLEAGGSFTGGTLYDVIDIKTSGAGGQQFTVGNADDDILGAPASTGYYKFTNPGAGAAVGLFSINWEELPST